MIQFIRLFPHAVAAVCVFAVLALGWYADRLRAENREARAQIERLSEEVLAVVSQRENVEAVLTSRIEAKNRIQTVTKEVIREVQVRVPADSCPLADDWGLLHDSAAAGQPPPPPGNPDDRSAASDLDWGEREESASGAGGGSGELREISRGEQPASPVAAVDQGDIE